MVIVGGLQGRRLATVNAVLETRDRYLKASACGAIAVEFEKVHREHHARVHISRSCKEGPDPARE